MEKKSSVWSVVVVALLSGFVSIILVDALFLFLFPSGWLFFIIPAIIGFSLKKFAKFPKDRLADDDEFEKISKRVGWLCAGICLVAILVGIIPIYLLSGENIFTIMFTDVIFYAVCAVCVYFGYSKGKEVVSNAYYDSLAE